MSSTRGAGPGQIEVRRYVSADRDQWDRFVVGCRNGLFIFLRDYMDYHADRFTDHSLVITRNGHWIAALPANRYDDVVHSHQGLTFGGMLSTDAMGVALMLKVWEATCAYLVEQGVGSLRYKAIPHIYHRTPAEEDLYALFRLGATLWRVDASSAARFDTGGSTNVKANKRGAVRRAERLGIRIEQSEGFDEFFELLATRLERKYGAVPTHTCGEMVSLHRRFPERIQLFGAFDERSQMLAGAIIYLYDHVAHTQYIASSEQGRRLRGVDAVVMSLFERFSDHRFFDLGHSNEQDGTVLNEGLAGQKEEFGARAVAHLFLRLDLT